MHSLTKNHVPWKSTNYQGTLSKFTSSGERLMEWVIGWIIGTLIGALIGQSKGRAIYGAFWAALLGPIGWLIVALGANVKPKCNECGGVVMLGARRCKNCGSLIDRLIELRCAHCKERGYVRESAIMSPVTCPGCKRTFVGASTTR